MRASRGRERTQGGTAQGDATRISSLGCDIMHHHHHASINRECLIHPPHSSSSYCPIIIIIIIHTWPIYTTCAPILAHNRVMMAGEGGEGSRVCRPRMPRTSQLHTHSCSKSSQIHVSYKHGLYHIIPIIITNINTIIMGAIFCAVFFHMKVHKK